MSKNSVGLHMDYDVKMGLGKQGSAPLSSVSLRGDYRIPVMVLAGVVTLFAVLAVTRCVCFHMKYKKRA